MSQRAAPHAVTPCPEVTYDRIQKAVKRAMRSAPVEHEGVLALQTERAILTFQLIAEAELLRVAALIGLRLRADDSAAAAIEAINRLNSQSVDGTIYLYPSDDLGTRSVGIDSFIPVDQGLTDAQLNRSVALALSSIGDLIGALPGPSD